MAKLLEELMVMRKWEMETMILRLGPHGSGWSPVPLVMTMVTVTFMMMMMVINRMILVLKENDSHLTTQWQALQC